MSLVLLVLGIVVAASGVATIGFGIPINEFTLGTTLIVAGTTALTGGLLLVAISAVVGELARLRNAQAGYLTPESSARNEVQPKLPAAAAVPGPLTVSVPARTRGLTAAPAPGPVRAKPEVAVVREGRSGPASSASSVEVSAAAIERLRSTIPRNEASRPDASPSVEEVPLSPNEALQPQSAATTGSGGTPVTEPKVTAEDTTDGSATEALKESRLDFLFRSKPARPVRERENFDTIWPAETTRAPRPPSSPTQSRHEQVERQAATTTAPPKAAPEQPQVVKSGVVDGMAYTLYADGSIEAKLPEGTVRFGSIAELRAHIESSS
jgi:hypothetical protein